MQLNLNNIYIYRTTKHSVNRITKRRSFSPRTLHLQFPRHASSRSALKMGYVQLLILLNEFCKHVTWNAQSFIQRKSNYNNDHIKNHVLKAKQHVPASSDLKKTFSKTRYLDLKFYTDNCILQNLIHFPSSRTL